MVGDSSQLWDIEKSITGPAFQNDPGSAESFLRERNRPTSIADTNREIEHTVLYWCFNNQMLNYVMAPCQLEGPA